MIMAILLLVLVIHACSGNYIHNHYIMRNRSRAVVTRTTMADIEQYRSALTLDLMAAEDMRQREIVATFESDKSGQRLLASDCMSYGKPSTGKVARLLIELLKNLEGDEGTLITDFIQALVNSKMLFETSSFDNEPDLEALIKTPGMMLGEPHTTFPRIIAMLWMIITDPNLTMKNGWCPIRKVTKFLHQSRPIDVAHQFRRLQPIIFRMRYIVEEFIQTVTPLRMYHTTASVAAFRAADTSTTVSTTYNTTVSDTTTVESVATSKVVFPRHDTSEIDEEVTFVQLAPSPTTTMVSTPRIGLLYEMPFNRDCEQEINFYLLLTMFVIRALF